MDLPWITSLLQRPGWSSQDLQRLRRTVGAIGAPPGSALDGGRELLSGSEEERAVDYLILSTALAGLYPQWRAPLAALSGQLWRLLEHHVPDGRRDELLGAVAEGVRRVQA
jgi:hypothetical protein